MCPKWNCMLAAAILILAFFVQPVEAFEQTNSFVYYVTSYELSGHTGGSIRKDTGSTGFSDHGWFRQGVKTNNTQQGAKDSARLSVFLHLFFALSAFLTADPFAGRRLGRLQVRLLPAARFLWELMTRQKKDGKKWYPAAA